MARFLYRVYGKETVYLVVSHIITSALVFL